MKLRAVDLVLGARLAMVAGVASITQLAACGDNVAADPYRVASETFVDTFCVNSCTTGTEDDCRAELASELADAGAMLDEVGREQCTHCLEIKSGLLAAVVDCRPSMAQDAEVYAACDLDPAVDFDKDGDPANDHDEACGGAP